MTKFIKDSLLIYSTGRSPALFNELYVSIDLSAVGNVVILAWGNLFQLSNSNRNNQYRLCWLIYASMVYLRRLSSHSSRSDFGSLSLDGVLSLLY